MSTVTSGRAGIDIHAFGSGARNTSLRRLDGKLARADTSRSQVRIKNYVVVIKMLNSCFDHRTRLLFIVIFSAIYVDVEKCKLRHEQRLNNTYNNIY